MTLETRYSIYINPTNEGKIMTDFITVNLPLDCDTDDAITELNDYATDASITISDARIVNANDWGTVLVSFVTTRSDWNRYASFYDVPDSDDCIV